MERLQDLQAALLGCAAGLMISGFERAGTVALAVSISYGVIATHHARRHR